METKAPRETLLEELLGLVKRSESLVMGQQAVSAKLYGPRPTEQAPQTPLEMSVSGLLQHLTRNLLEIDRELERQHSGLGTLDQPISAGRAINAR